MGILDIKSYRLTFHLMIIGLAATAATSLLLIGILPNSWVQIAKGYNRDWFEGVLFLIGWILMCIAMMLPTAMPLLAALQKTTQHLANNNWVVLFCAVAFLAVWGATGGLILASKYYLQSSIKLPWIFLHQRIVAAGLLCLGGLYLQSSLALKCVSACRSPLGFIARHWTGRSNVLGQVGRIGFEYGLSCVGCCWPMMLLMCALGTSNPAWMIIFALFMAVQKNSLYGTMMTKLAGIIMLLAALLVLCDNPIIGFDNLYRLDAWITTVCRDR
jgi:predicted metal-binding membrane protein